MSLPPAPISSRPVTPARLAIWRVMAAQPQDSYTTVAAVAEAAKVSPATTERTLNILVGDLHAQVRQDDLDEPAWYWLTAAGRQAAAALLAQADREQLTGPEPPQGPAIAPQ